jgi:hypothetical protein
MADTEPKISEMFPHPSSLPIGEREGVRGPFGFLISFEL